MTGLIKPTIILILVIVITAGVLFAIKIWIRKKHDVSLMEKYLFAKRQVFKSLVFSLGSIVIFYVMIIAITYFAYRTPVDLWLIKQYLIVAGIGAIAIAFRFLFFGGIFFSGAIIGYIANCVVVLSQQGKTTMKGGFYNVIIIVFAVIVGIVFEIVIRGEYRRAIEKNTSENMSEPNGD